LPTLDIQPGATLRISGRRLDEIIMLAYNVGVKQLQGPQWLLEPTTDPTVVTRFEIQAKIPASAKKDDIPLMLQNLLADRFKLKVHREPKPTQVYSLEVSKGGHKLKNAVPNEFGSGCRRVIQGGEDYTAAADCYSMTMTQFAQQLQSLGPAYFREGPIVDNTGLTGTYDLRLEWRLLSEIEAGATGVTLPGSVEKLGLTLNKKRDNAEMLVIDNCEKVPSEN
jgi:uncharacterized protein (TIGR03435 family)